MDKIAMISMLYDFYGGLLTDNQKNIIDLYYNYDLSLTEISENLSISRQAVFDTLKRAENLLYEYEDKLKIVARYMDIQHIIKDVLSIINDICKHQNSKNDAIKKLESLKIQLDALYKK